jgi:hypothetical protein
VFRIIAKNVLIVQATCLGWRANKFFSVVEMCPKWQSKIASVCRGSVEGGIQNCASVCSQPLCGRGQKWRQCAGDVSWISPKKERQCPGEFSRVPANNLRQYAGVTSGDAQKSF